MNLQIHCSATCVSMLLMSPPPALAQTPPQPVPATAAAVTKAGWRTMWLEELPFYEPLLAEPRAARIAVTFPAWADRFEFSQEPGRRLVWDITLGKEIPILGLRRGESASDEFLAPGQVGIGFWTPVHWHMMEEFKDPSAPIINTDYRFGTMLKARVGLPPWGPWKQHVSEQEPAQLAFRFVPWAHESTHLGDEFSLAARRLFPSFERINVSYEYWEYGVSLEVTSKLPDPAPVMPKGPFIKKLIVRHGGLQPWGEDGYYSDHLLEAESRRLSISKENFEPLFGVQAHLRPGWGDFGFFASVDARYKAIYNYRKPTDDEAEDRQWSFNMLVGFERQKSDVKRALRDVYFRFYHGVNPHGQLRNQRDFTLFGAGFNFGVF